MDNKILAEPEKTPHLDEKGLDPVGLSTVNASGHEDSLRRQYYLFSSYGVALTIDSAWVALGGSLAIAIANGGPAGVLYEYLVACFSYLFIGASLAEFASSIPSTGGVYHWASVAAGPRYGRMLGFFAGLINFFAWMFNLAGAYTIGSSSILGMYSIWNPEYISKQWHVYVIYVVLVLISGLVLVFANRCLPVLNQIGAFLVMGGGLITIIVCATMSQHAASSFVWSNFSENNVTGWPDGVAFMIGVLNGAYTIGTPDGVTKLAEELPNPSHDLPKAIFVQVGVGLVSGFLYAIAILYAITDLSAVVAGEFPIAVIYAQATGSAAGAFGLLLIFFLNVFVASISTYLVVSRTWWALARDNVTPLAGVFKRANTRLSCPIQSVIFVGIFCCGLGAIQLGSTAAASDLFGSFIILSTLSYALAIAAHLLTRRRNMPKGPFWMASTGYIVNSFALTVIMALDIFFCFPASYTTTVSTMNYNSVIMVGLAFLITLWWLIHGRSRYPTPKVLSLYTKDGSM